MCAAEIKQRDLPLEWYAPRGVGFEHLELVARGRMPRLEDGSPLFEQELKASDAGKKRKLKDEAQDLGAYATNYGGFSTNLCL